MNNKDSFSKEMGTLYESVKLEREGKLEEAKQAYWKIIEEDYARGAFPTPFVYERLRIIYGNQKDWEGAIRACQAFLDHSKHVPQSWEVKRRKMQEWIRKYKIRLGKRPTVSVEQVVVKAVEDASVSAKSRISKNPPAFIPARAFPNWARDNIHLSSVEVPHFKQYFPSVANLNDMQLEFYNTWVHNWERGNPLDVKGTIGYLFIYAYGVVGRVQNNARDAIYELRLLQYVYKHERYFSGYLNGWIFDAYVLNKEYFNAIAYVQSRLEGRTWDVENSYPLFKVLSLKYELGVPISGTDILRLHNRQLRKLLSENLDFVVDHLEKVARDFEEKHRVDLLSLMSEQFAFPIKIWGAFGGVPSFHPRVDSSLRFFDYSSLGDFQIVINEWMKDTENLLREAKGLPRIGEGWIRESLLYNTIVEIFEEFGYEVLHHAHPWFLGRQELDIYIPVLKLGIEHQGIQHYEPSDFFGGEEGFNELVVRDERKKRLCEENEVTLVYFKYDEPIEEEYVRSKLIEHCNFEFFMGK